MIAYKYPIRHRKVYALCKQFNRDDYSLTTSVATKSISVEFMRRNSNPVIAKTIITRNIWSPAYSL